jgi:hypothetical protein
VARYDLAMALFGKRATSEPMDRLSADQIDAVNFWMSQEFAKRSNAAAWNIIERRMALGAYVGVAVSAPQDARFWLNAYPALCSLVVGPAAIKEPAAPAWWADQARQNADRSNDSQVRALDSLGPLL